MREYKLSLTWVLVIAAGSVFAASFLAAVTPLGEQMNALAVTIAGDVVCSQCVGTNGDGTNDIKDGSVTNSKLASSAVSNSKLASNAVTGSKIAAGAITSADVSTGFVKVVNLVDTNCGCEGQWDPNGTLQNIVVNDNKVTPKSVISLTITNGYAMVCTANLPQAGDFVVSCNSLIPDGFGLSYVVINK